MLRNNQTFSSLLNVQSLLQKQLIVGMILAIALIAFEMFNFDTTQYALNNLLGDIRFLTVPWASILAVAFCAIDFAGLVRFFTPDKQEDAKEAWFLMGAWLLGATMNALMTWWAISLTLLNHEFGNEVLSRSQLLQIVPIFVAVLVWLTRILFIGGLTMAGEHFFSGVNAGTPRPVARPNAIEPVAPRPTMPAFQPSNAAPPRPVRPSRPAATPTMPTPIAVAQPAMAAPTMPEPEPEPIAPTMPRTVPRPITTPSPVANRRPQADRQRPPMPPIGQRLPLKAKGISEN